jgi:hypothetical protein
MATVHRIDSALDIAKMGDVVFIHGLDGHWSQSWCHETAQASWPAWLADERPDLRIWSVDYDASSTNWRGRAMPIRDRAINVLDALLNHQIGSYPLCFVIHSMGGLLVKQMIRHAEALSTHIPQYFRFVESCKGVMFLATPHTGSDLGRLATFLSHVLRPSDAMRDLETNTELLRDLNEWYRNKIELLNISNKVYFEKRDMAGLRVVDETSSDPGIAGIEVIPIDASHIEICKPIDRTDQVFLGSLRFLADAMETGGGPPIPIPIPIGANSLIPSSSALVPIYKRSKGGDIMLVAYMAEP